MCDTFQEWHRGLMIGRWFMVWGVLAGLCLSGGSATAQFNIQQGQPLVDPAQAPPMGYSGQYPPGAVAVSSGTTKKKEARPLPEQPAPLCHTQFFPTRRGAQQIRQCTAHDQRRHIG